MSVPVFTAVRLSSIFLRWNGCGASLFKSYGFNGCPQILVIGPDGNVITSAVPTDPKLLVDMIKRQSIDYSCTQQIGSSQMQQNVFTGVFEKTVKKTIRFMAGKQYYFYFYSIIAGQAQSQLAEPVMDSLYSGILRENRRSNLSAFGLCKRYGCLRCMVCSGWGMGHKTFANTFDYLVAMGFAPPAIVVRCVTVM